MSPNCSRLAVLSAMALACAAPLAAQTALPIGKQAQGRVSSGGSTDYTVVAKTAGVLVAAVRGDGDMVVQVTDSDGQVLPEGRSDRDLNGSTGNELLSVILPEAGSYRVRVSVNGSGAARFDISGSFLAFPAFEVENSDPDRRPTTAREVPVNQSLEDSLNSEEGDNWDWFLLKPTQSGTLAIVIRRQGDGDGDLVLEAYVGGRFEEPTERSDQDLQGNNANESVTFDVNAGQTVHVKVAALYGNVDTRYRLSSNLVP